MAGDIEQPFTFNFQVESAISDSISFGRFEKESLSWERRSSFSHNRYLEEVEKFSKPGSVNEKKAYFEAHFKKKGGLLGPNSAESHTIENDVPEQVNQEADIEIINMENHDGHFDDSSVSSQDHGDHLVTEFEKMPKHGISAPNPQIENYFSRVNAEINEQDDNGENKLTFVSDEPEVEIKNDANSHGMSENMSPEAMAAVPKTELVKKAGKNSSGSQQTHTPKIISRKETKASPRSQANISLSRRNVSGDVLKSNKSKGDPSHSTFTGAHPSKTAISRANAVRRTPKVEDSKVLKGRTVLESGRCGGEKLQTSGVSYSSPSKLESRSYLKTTTRQSRTVNSAIQDPGKSASASNRSTGLAERRKQGKPDSEMKKLQKTVDIRTKPISSSYGAVRPESNGMKAVFSGTKVRNTLRKSTAVVASSSHSQLGKDIVSSASEASYTSKTTSYHAAVHLEASGNSSSSSANKDRLQTENERRKDKAKEKEPNVQKSRMSENYKTTSKQGSEGRQKVGARTSMNLVGRSRDIKSVGGSGMGQFAVGVTS